MPDATIAEIVDRRKRGETYRAICRALNVGQSTVRQYAKHVVPPVRYQQGWDSGARQRIVRNVAFAYRLRRAGFTYREIGAELDCCCSEVARIFRDRKTKGTGGPVSGMVQRVSAVSGVPCSHLRKTNFENGGRGQEGSAKARHILFWMIRTRVPNMAYPKIGISLGGFDHSSIIYGVRRVEALVERAGITDKMRPLTVIRRLWALEWPRGAE